MYAIVKYLKFGNNGVIFSDSEYTYAVDVDQFEVGDIVLAGKYKSPAVIIKTTKDKPQTVRTVEISGKTLAEYLSVPKI